MPYKVQVIAISVFITLDIVSGFAAAASTKSINSAAMREGMWHKLAFALTYILSFALEMCMSVMDLGFTIPTAGAVAVYIIGTETVSILENICILNPELKDKGLMKLFGDITDDIW